MEKVKTDFRCDYCGGSGMIFYIEDRDIYGTYGTLVCSRCGAEEEFVEGPEPELRIREGMIF